MGSVDLYDCSAGGGDYAVAVAVTVVVGGGAGGGTDDDVDDDVDDDEDVDVDGVDGVDVGCQSLAHARVESG